MLALHQIWATKKAPQTVREADHVINAAEVAEGYPDKDGDAFLAPLTMALIWRATD
jgi:hypothetical protein